MEALKDDHVHVGALDLRFLVDETTGAGDLVMFEFTVPAAARVPAPHYHRGVDEAVYGISGTLTVTLDGARHEIRAGDSIFIPRGSVHHHENHHAETARVLIVLTPGTIGRRYFEDIAEAVNVPGKPDLARVKAVMERHGLVPA